MNRGQEPGRSVGIMGGTFDPIHYGHLVTAETVRHAFNLQQVIFLPSGRPPHKGKHEVTDSYHRHMMVVIATVDNPHFAVSTYEIERTDWSYTIDTVRWFRQQLGPAVDLWFITGADAILQITIWKDPTELLGECRFIAATRPGYDLTELNRVVGKLGSNASDRIHRISVPGLAISSSDIRDKVADSRPIKYLVPSSVERYIHKHRLYRRGGHRRGDETRSD